jgi:hypothetical protein
MKFYCYRCDEDNPCTFKCPDWSRPGEESFVNRCPCENTIFKKGVPRGEGTYPKARWTTVQR